MVGLLRNTGLLASVMIWLWPLCSDASRYQIFPLGIDFHPTAIEKITYAGEAAAKISVVRVAGNIDTTVSGVTTRMAYFSDQALDISGNTGGTIGFGPAVPLPLTIKDTSNVVIFTATQSSAVGMNINGTIVGWVIEAITGIEYAVYWSIIQNVYTLHLLALPAADIAAQTAGKRVYARATSIDNLDNIVGYSTTDPSGAKTRRAVAWQINSSTGISTFKPKDLGDPITGEKDSQNNDIHYFTPGSDDPPRAGITIKIREGYIVGMWDNPLNSFPTPVVWNINGVGTDAFVEVSGKLRNTDTRPYVTDLAAANFITGWTIDSLLEQPAGYDAYAIALEEINFDTLLSNRTIARWYATVKQQEGTDRVIATGYGLTNGIGDLGIADSMKILALSPPTFRFGGTAAVPGSPPQPQAFMYSEQCGLQNANHLHNTSDATETTWNLQSITTMSSKTIGDPAAQVIDTWMAGLGTRSVPAANTRYGFVMMPASIPLDLSVTLSAYPSSLEVGEKIAYTISVLNVAQKPTDRATCVRVEFTNPPGFTVLDAQPFRGQCEITISYTRCLIPYMLHNEQGSIVLSATPRPMLADRNNNIAKAMVYSTETSYVYNRDTTPQDNFPYDSSKANNVAQVSANVKRQGCFIATAAYGSYLSPHVQALREFRDQVLLKSALGRWIIDGYYNISPPIAEWISSRPPLQFVTRTILTPVVYAVLYPTWLLIAIIFMLTEVMMWRWCLRGTAAFHV